MIATNTLASTGHKPDTWPATQEEAPAPIPLARKALVDLLAATVHSDDPTAFERAVCEAFDAIVAHRLKQYAPVPYHACKAIEYFETLSWYAYTARLLTPREREVAGFALRGLTNRVIAEMLSISERTVEAHMTSIFNRLGIRCRHQLAMARILSQ